MRPSCRFAMAVHVLALLGYTQEEWVSSAFLAASVNTNPVVIRRLLLNLRRAGLIDTCKGAGAGSRLSRPAGRINLAEICRAVEETEPFGAPSRRPSSVCPVGRSIGKVLNSVFASARQALECDLERVTVADVIASIGGTKAQRLSGGRCRRAAGRGGV